MVHLRRTDVHFSIALLENQGLSKNAPGRLKSRADEADYSKARKYLHTPGRCGRTNGRKTIIHPDGSKTIYDSRVEGDRIEVPLQAESPLYRRRDLC